MAQNITLLGANYPSVPAVLLPKTGGGTARFDDTSDANAAAADIAQGKTAYVNGAKVTGTASGGITPTGNIDITHDGVTDVTNYATATVPNADANGVVSGAFVNVSGGRKFRISGVSYAEAGGWVDGDDEVGVPATHDYDIVPANTTITPSATAQTVGGANTMMEGPVTVAAAPSGALVSTLFASVTPAISVDDDGLVTASGEDYASESVVYQAGWLGSNTSLVVYKSAYAQEQLPTQSATTITPSTTAQTAVAKGKWTTGAITVAAMPSGTAGTPTATKGTVSNHSVTITPSVTNTTGYITGGTKTGTAVTVTAAELVSGSETKTANGTYDVTNLAQLIVNVAGGGGGLVYEAGEYKPTSDIARATIQFTNTHTEAPVLVALADVTGTASDTTSSNHLFCFFDPYKIWGKGFPYTSSGYRYAVAYYLYRSNSTSSLSSSSIMCSHNSDSTDSTDNSYPRYWASPTDFHPYTNSPSRYWRSGRTYKWIAVWKPTIQGG